MAATIVGASVQLDLVTAKIGKTGVENYRSRGRGLDLTGTVGEKIDGNQALERDGSVVL